MPDRPVILYVTADCPQCDAARRFLGERGVEFEEVEVGADTLVLRELVRLAGHAAVPTIVVGDDVQVGFDASRIDDMLANPLPPEEDELAGLSSAPPAPDDEAEPTGTA